MQYCSEKNTFQLLKYIIILFTALISPTLIVAQLNQYCDTSVYSEVNSMYKKAELLESQNKTGSIPILKKAIKLDTTFAAAYFKLGEIFHRKAIISQYDIQYHSHTGYYYRKASNYFIKTIELCEGIKNYAPYFYLGEQYYLQQEYSLAGYYLDLYLKKSTVSLPGFDIANTYYSNYLKWKEWKNNPFDISIIPVDNLCTEKNELYPFISSNGQFFYFTRQYERQKPNSLYYENVKEFYISYIEAIDSNENWVFSKGTKMEWPFNDNSPFKELYANIQNSEMYLSYYNRKKAKNKYIDIGTIYYSNNKDGYWEEPEKLTSKINIGGIYNGQPCLSSDGKKLFFVSNRAGGVGGADIYYCTKDSAGNWGEPTNIGNKINTINDEQMPFIHYDNKTLYFASNGHFGMGGLDIFMSRLNDDGNWEVPKNLGRPINTPANEFGLILDARGIKGYFASKALPGYGGWDIFCTDIPNKFRPNEMIILNGKITDTDSTPILSSFVEVLNLATQKYYTVLNNSESGTFSSIIPKEDNTYYIKVTSDGYSFGNMVLNGIQNSHTYFANIRLTKLKKGAKFYLNHACFDAYSNIEFTSIGIISDFAEYLAKYKNLNIKIIGINPNQPTSESFGNLSKKASKLYQFLIQKGISNHRLSYKTDTILISNMPTANLTNSEIIIEIIDL